MRVVTGALVVAGVLVFPLTQASADPGNGGAAGDAELARRQAPMLVLADELEAASGGGFAGVELDVPGGVVHLYAKGGAPKGVGTLAAKAPGGIRVQVHPAEYSAAELRERAEEIIRTRGLSAGGDVHRVTPMADGSGLELGVTSQAGMAKVAGERMVVGAEVESVTPYDGRWGGNSPFEGGIQINACSASFGGLMSPAREDWVYPAKLITAAHCFSVGDEVRTGNSTTGTVVIGHVEAVNPQLDTALIAVDPGKFVTGWMWDGGVQDGSEFGKPVVGTSQARKGSLVCASGAWSGVHCDIKITKTDSTLDWGTHTSRAVSIGDQLQGQLAAGGGDSGGPVFTLTGDFSSVLAAGVIIGGDSKKPATCTYVSSRCSTRLFFTDFRTVRSYWGLSWMAGQGPEGL
ncbi:chymotrypsin family serine protease [Sphaerisporangium aureirubrum]|uniref:Serine protease n=1 Tax=Sphaerisporangium aureirubrum TaxID=1544736 RepID=A0ABW1NHD3_9ACTN